MAIIQGDYMTLLRLFLLTILSFASAREVLAKSLTLADRRELIQSDVHTPELSRAVKIYDIDNVQELIAQGMDLDEQDNHGMTALHHAVWRQMPEIVQLLIDAGADLDAEDKKGWTPLHVAKSLRDAKMVEFLIAAGANPDIK